MSTEDPRRTHRKGVGTVSPTGHTGQRSTREGRVMHYALTVLDKSNGTQSDAGPINAGGGIVPAGRALSVILDNLSDEVADAHRRSVARDLLSAIDRREQGLEYPWDRVTARGTDGPAVRIDVHDTDDCDCEI